MIRQGYTERTAGDLSWAFEAWYTHRGKLTTKNASQTLGILMMTKEGM
jgi:hypothetical protein